MNGLLVGLSGGSVSALDLIFIITLVAFLPSITVMMISFTRIIIIFSSIRSAMEVQQTPLNMVLVGMALSLTLYIMNLVIGGINEEAYQPYIGGEMIQQETADRMGGLLKEFMLRNAEKSTLDHFVWMSGTDIRESAEDHPLTVVAPVFAASELERSFVSSLLIYLLFPLIDVVVATILMSVGMVVLPPAMTMLPSRLLLFVTVDGWELLFPSIIQSLRQDVGEGGRRT